jgi:acrylyl-CoA reductase (NADPH)/3-hydroxypropionyl-CoA dehydratase/3-hydroxypropionyl-CoA synthetase
MAWWRGDLSTLALGAPFRPGLDPLPAYHQAWAVVKDRWGRPAHDEPGRTLIPIVTRVPSVGPNEALGYVLYAGLTYNTVFAARGVPVSVFDLHDEDAHVPGSGAIVLVAALGSEVAREGRLRVGELRVLYPGVSSLLSPRAGADPMHADFKIQGYETPDGSFAQFVRAQAPQLLAHSERLTLAEASSFMLDLETVYKALYDVACLRSDERVFVEGAAGGTGMYAVTCAVARGACVTGLVSTEAKANVERAEELQRLLAHHDRIPRPGPARAILEAVRVGLTKGLEEGLAFEARAFGELVASTEGRVGLDRFLARRAWPLPLRPADSR